MLYFSDKIKIVRNAKLSISFFLFMSIYWQFQYLFSLRTLGKSGVVLSIVISAAK